MAEDIPFQLQRSNVIPRAAMSSLAKSSLMPLKASPGSDIGSPFSSPALNCKAGILDLSSPWHGSVQSPLVMRRGPKLWTSGSGKDFSITLVLILVVTELGANRDLYTWEEK